MKGRNRGYPVVGRDDELAVFQRAVARAAEGQPGVLLVSGDPGIGKSTLIAEAARRTGTPLYLGRCVHVGGDAIPLAPLVDLIRQIQRGCDVDQLPSLESLSELATSGAGRVGDVFTLALELVGELGAAGPVIVGWDDLHWGDPATWDLFEHIARNLVDEQVVVVGAYRADEVVRDPGMRRRTAELTRLGGVERVTLAGLARNAVAVQAAAVLGIPPPPAFVDELLRRGEGNPFFTEQLVAAHLAGDAIPPLLWDLLEADIAALDPAGRHVLAALATVGRDTDPELLAAVVELDEAATEVAVRAAVDARLLVVEPATDAYRVRHPLIGEVAYHAALPTERRRLHRAVATALQAQPRFALTASDAAGELAFHLDRGGDEAAAFEALFAAADSAERIAPATCLAHLERIFELWEQHATPEHQPQLVPRLWQAADLASATGHNERAVTLARRALELGDPPEGRAWAYERLGRFQWSSGSIEESAETYTHAAAILDTAPERDATGAALTYGGLAQADLMFCRFDRAEHWARRALTAAPSHDAASRSAALRVLGLVETLAGDIDVGLEHSRAAVDESLSPHRWALANAMLAMILLEVGRTEEALTVAEDGAARSQRAGFETSFGTFHAGVAARCLVRLGRWDEADNVLAGVASLDSTPIGAIQLDAASAPLAARRGQVEAAADLAERLRRHPHDPFSDAIINAALLDVHLAAKRWDRAIHIASSALNPKPNTGARLVARFTAGLVTATVEQTLDNLARKEAVDLDATLLDLGHRIDEARADPGSASPAAAADVALAEAMITRLRRSDPTAFTRAAEAAEQIGDAWGSALARLREADAAASAGASAQAVDALRTAHDTANTLGAKALVDDIEALARRTRISLDAPTVPIVAQSDVVRLGLTSREAEVLALVAAGKTNREIGAELYVSEKTASVHVSNILRKLGVSTRVDAAAIAQRIGVA
jgi:DNA-binding CsgD family transcriptional regulator/tetratricopeptide (TPR) repeat protein